jgi:large subunit ribosomal protein L4
VLTAEESNAALSFRNLARVAVLTHESVGVADLLGAASLVISQPALDALTARAAGSATAEVLQAKDSKAAKTKKPAAADEVKA